MLALLDQRHLLVSLQLLDEGALMEQGLQPLLGVVVAELLKGGAALLLGQSRVLEARGVHDEQGAQRVLAGLQSPVLKATLLRVQSDLFSLSF